MDAIGAGDGFTAGLLYHRYSFQECVLFGNITGGACVSAGGCLTNRFTEEQLLEDFRVYHKLVE